MTHFGSLEQKFWYEYNDINKATPEVLESGSSETLSGQSRKPLLKCCPMRCRKRTRNDTQVPQDLLRKVRLPLGTVYEYAYCSRHIWHVHLSVVHDWKTDSRYSVESHENSWENQNGCLPAACPAHDGFPDWLDRKKGHLVERSFWNYGKVSKTFSKAANCSQVRIESQVSNCSTRCLLPVSIRQWSRGKTHMVYP